MLHSYRLLRIKTASSFGTRSETEPQIYDLYQRDERFLVVHSRVRDDGKRGRTTREVDSGETASILEKLRRVQVPVAPDPVMGCDGGTTELEIGAARFSWWSVPPDGWGELDRLTYELVELFDAAVEGNSRELS